MSARIGRSFLMGWGSLVLALGCGKGQMGGEVESGAGDGCVDGVVTAIAEDDDVPGAAFKLSSVITAVEGQHEIEMAWQPADAASFEGVEVSPQAGLSMLRIEVEPLPESGRLIDRVHKKHDSGAQETLQDYASQCLDRMAVDAQVTISSDNGALDQTFLVTFWSADGVVVHGEIAAEPAEWGGSFAVDVAAVEGEVELIQTSLDMATAFGAWSGRLSGGIVRTHGDAATLAPVTYARFPTENACETGYLLPSDTPLRGQVEDLLNAHTQFDFAWQGEATQELTVTVGLSDVCYVEQAYGNSAGFRAKVEAHVQLADDSVDGQWPLDAIITQDESGELTRVELLRESYLGVTFTPDEFAEQTGILGVESVADALSFSFGLALDVTGQTPASGELTIMELTEPECAPMEIPEESSSPGCRGTDVQEIKNAQFVERLE